MISSILRTDSDEFANLVNNLPKKACGSEVPSLWQGEGQEREIGVVIHTETELRNISE